MDKWREQLIAQIKQAGQDIIDGAENYVNGLPDYTLRISVNCDFDVQDVPTITWESSMFNKWILDNAWKGK